MKMFDLGDLLDFLLVGSDSTKFFGWLLLNAVFGAGVYFLCLGALETTFVSDALHAVLARGVGREALATGAAIGSLLPFNLLLWRLAQRWG